MKGNAVVIGLVLVGALWIYLALESYGRGKLGIGLMQLAAAAAFIIRAAVEWRKQRI